MVVRMNLPFFAVEAYLRGGFQNQAEKNRKMPGGVRKSIFQYPLLFYYDVITSEKLL